MAPALPLSYSDACSESVYCSLMIVLSSLSSNSSFMESAKLSESRSVSFLTLVGETLDGYLEGMRLATVCLLESRSILSVDFFLASYFSLFFSSTFLAS